MQLPGVHIYRGQPEGDHLQKIQAHHYGHYADYNGQTTAVLPVCTAKQGRCHSQPCQSCGQAHCKGCCPAAVQDMIMVDSSSNSATHDEIETASVHAISQLRLALCEVAVQQPQLGKEATTQALTTHHDRNQSAAGRPMPRICSIIVASRQHAARHSSEHCCWLIP